MHKLKSICMVLFLIVLASFFLNGCATVLKGYEDEVRLENISDSLRIFTKDGVEIPVVKSISRTIDGNGGKYTDKTSHSIRLRSSQSYTLVLKTGEKEKRIEVHPHIDTGWFIIDLITLTFWVDAYTGSWNYFCPIDAGF